MLESATAVVVNYETPEYTTRAVRALVEDGLPPERIVVVDNGSTDGSQERLARELAPTRVERIDENVGYARASNRGASLLPGEAYFLVNSDAFVDEPGSLRAMTRVLEEEERVGIVVPRLLNEDRTLQPNAMPPATPGVAFVRASGVSRLIPNRWQTRWSTHWDHASVRDIEVADGPVYLVRGSLWDELGGYTERHYMYAEDLDLCWRARQAGAKIRFTPEARFVHVGMGSTGNRWSSAERAERIGRSEAAMIREHLPPLKARLTVGFLAAGLGARWAIHRTVGNRDAAASLRGSLRGYLS